MSIVVIGVNHRTGPLAVLERVALSVDAVPKAVHSLQSRNNIAEVVVVSTCNRIEVYAVAERFHGAYADIRDFFCELGGLAPDELHPHLYSQHDEAAVTHLFEVAAGLDSAVLGEHEILGQVRSAWELAQAEGGSRAALNLLFRHAVEVGKRARTETSIGRSTASVSHAAVEMAKEHLGELTGRRVLVVGAGDMSEGMAVAIASNGVAEMAVANRTFERAATLARRVSGRVAPFADLPAGIAEADLVLTGTGSGHIIIDHDMVAAAMSARPHRPLLVVDIAVPRDVDSAVAQIPGVSLLDLDDLRTWAAKGIELRKTEADKVRVIVAEEVERYVLEATSRQAAPLVAQLHERAEAVRAAEVARQARRLAALTPAQREAVEAVTRGVVAKLLHGPSVRLKDDVGSPRGERNAAAVRDLFDLQ
ncbi:MAG TPA: glutamyl-tRNA reductase [Ilumatobacteraceae bacterium]